MIVRRCDWCGYEWTGRAHERAIFQVQVSRLEGWRSDGGAIQQEFDLCQDCHDGPLHWSFTSLTEEATTRLQPRHFDEDDDITIEGLSDLLADETRRANLRSYELRKADGRRRDALATTAELLKTVEQCRAQFRMYERLHLEKGSEDGQRKATANAAMAQLCDAAIEKFGNPNG